MKWFARELADVAMYIIALIAFGAAAVLLVGETLGHRETVALFVVVFLACRASTWMTTREKRSEKP